MEGNIFSQTEEVCHEKIHAFTNREIVFTSTVVSEGTHGGVCCEFRKNYVVKYFDVDDNEADEFGMTPKRYFENETKAYKLLNNVKYVTSDGRELFIVPQCLEIGKNYMIFERYETSLYDMICHKRYDVLHLL